MLAVKLVKSRKLSFESEIAKMECRNFERLMRIHLDRCTDPDAAFEIAMVLMELSQDFAKIGCKTKTNVVS